MLSAPTIDNNQMPRNNERFIRTITGRLIKGYKFKRISVSYEPFQKST